LEGVCDGYGERYGINSGIDLEERGNLSLDSFRMREDAGACCGWPGSVLLSSRN
jgi:hypothetical protein